MIFTVLWGKKTLKDTQGVNLACGLLTDRYALERGLVYGAPVSN
jgi:hypothetical protein